MKKIINLNCDRVWLGKLTDIIYSSTIMNDFQIIEAIYLLNHHLQETNPDLSLRQNCIPLIGAFDLGTHAAGRCDFPCQLDSRGNGCGFRSAINRPGGRLAKVALVAARQVFPYYYYLQP